MDNLLTICIPTFNRANILRKKLEKLSSLNNRHCFSVLVCDNASIDHTRQVVSSFIDLITNLQYHCNDLNIGYDANILKCLDLSTTAYAWILSDDDEFTPNAPDRILQYISSFSPDLICLNDGDQAVRLSKVSGPDNKLINLNPGNLNIVENPDESLRFTYVSTFFWISRLVLKRRSFSYSLKFKKYVGSSIIQLAIVNDVFICRQSVRLVYSDLPLVRNIPHIVFSPNFVNVFVNGFYEFCMVPESQFTHTLALSVAKQNFPFVVNSLRDYKVGIKIINYDFKPIYLIKKMLKYKSSPILIGRFVLLFFFPSRLFRLLTRSPVITKNSINTETFI